MSDVRRVCTRFGLFAIFFVLLSEVGLALPVFARRYGTSCTTCHVVIPKLNPFGIAFRNNGYRVPLNDESLVKTPDVSLGAPAWRTLWPKAVWPGAIPGMPPIAVRAMLDANIRPSSNINLNFNFPSGLVGYFAGSAGESFSFFGNVFLSGSSGTLSLDRAYGQFRLVPESPGENWLMLKVGRIDSRAEPFSNTFKRLTAQNFGVSDYQAVPDAMRLRDHDAGIELWGAATGPDNRGGIEYAVGVVQGTNGAAENNNFKDYYASASYKFGGHGVVGSRREKSAEQLTSPEEYAETSFGFGGFVYKGKGQPRITGVTEDSLIRSGVKFDAWIQELNVFAAAVRGKDRLRGVAPRTVETSAIMAEANYRLLPWVMPTFRFEKTNFSDGRRNIVQLIPSVSFLVRANVRVLAEGRFFNRINRGAEARTGTNEGIIRLEFLF